MCVGRENSSPHDLLFEGALRDKTINIYDLLLTDTMGPIHRLEVLHRVPVMLNEYDGIRSRQGQSQATDVGCEKQAVDTGVGVERLDNGMALLRIRTSIQAHVRDRRHVLLEQVGLDDVDHLLHLTEDEDAVL